MNTNQKEKLNKNSIFGISENGEHENAQQRINNSLFKKVSSFLIGILKN